MVANESVEDYDGAVFIAANVSCQSIPVDGVVHQ